jgi:hypothetical protein
MNVCPGLRMKGPVRPIGSTLSPAFIARLFGLSEDHALSCVIHLGTVGALYASI